MFYIAFPHISFSILLPKHARELEETYHSQLGCEKLERNEELSLLQGEAWAQTSNTCLLCGLCTLPDHCPIKDFLSEMRLKLCLYIWMLVRFVQKALSPGLGT